MFKINMILYFYIATSFVAGEWQPQDNGQNQLRYSIPSPPAAPQFPPGFVPEPPRIPQARPCRRQNYGNNGELGAMLTDSGWIPLPSDQPSPSFATHDQQTRSQPTQPQLKPQSLTENKAPAVDDQKQSPKSRFPDKIVEYVEKSSLPSQMSQDRYADENENNSFETGKGNQDSSVFVVHMGRSGYPDQTGFELVDSHEIPHECLRHGNADQDLKYGNSETQSLSKSAPKQPHEHVVKILPDCVQESRRAMQDLEGDSKIFEPNSQSSTELDKTEAESSSKTEPVDDSKTNLEKTARVPTNKIKPYLLNPAKNAGKWQSDQHVSLMENNRVCYACSTYYDTSCWSTNATTTVKYCNKDNSACVSKLYKIEGKMILIRDCGHTCNEKEDYQVGQKMSSCSMCHTDLCNGAGTLHSLTALVVTFILSALKFTS